ncbi:SDH family Clp fold serine proteinase [Aeropyrum camini]|uniref:Periplasmic serine protease n=1 Tax=Aeropyrum camini SY1 = JCM 12091 TaxID=1198449 RepID=U3TEI3_9CREN|nr:ATP-dependent Clp protease proteolytic subunit [Aeropyrum camini]BAN90856.1 periplasmic serine protease [Aeropyrum camini SY1 = JCM 12091]
MVFDFSSLVWLLFWLLLLASMLNPVLAVRRLQAARLELIRSMERKYGWRVITMIHREERVSFFGIPLRRFIDIDDSEAVVRAIRSTPPEKPIALILHTPGGLVLAASQIARALKRHKGRKIVIVPHYAMSGGTLIALAADEIRMDPNAVLGPLDPQLSAGPTGPAVPAPSVVKVAKMKGKDAQDTTLIMADVAEKAIEEMREVITELLQDKVGVEKAREIAVLLTEGRWTHDYPITFERAKEMGLPVSDEVPPEVYQLMELYPQAPANRPGVEYLPQPTPYLPRQGSAGEGG